MRELTLRPWRKAPRLQPQPLLRRCQGGSSWGPRSGGGRGGDQPHPGWEEAGDGRPRPRTSLRTKKKNIDQWNYGNKFSATFPESYFDPQLVNGDVSGQDGAADEGGGGHHGQEPPRRGGSLQSTHR